MKEEAVVRRLGDDCVRAGHQETAKLRTTACCPCACAHSEQQGDHDLLSRCLCAQ